VIRELLILDVVADVGAVELLGERGRLEVLVPEIRLSDVGGSEGVAMSELSSIVIKAVLTAVARSGTGLPRELAGALHGGLGGLTGVAFQVGGEITLRAVGAGETVVTEAAQSALERVAGDAARAVGSPTDKALRGLGGLLRREEDDE
jgi:hypothetical protein